MPKHSLPEPGLALRAGGSAALSGHVPARPTGEAEGPPLLDVHCPHPTAQPYAIAALVPTNIQCLMESLPLALQARCVQKRLTHA